MMTKEQIKSAFESLLFVWGEPLDVRVAAELFHLHWKDAYEYFEELQTEYEEAGRGILIREIDRHFQFCTNIRNHEYIERLCTPAKAKKLSASALEVLAIIAYKQPVTKAEIEAIRGIKCDRVIDGLIKKGLVEEVGRSSAIGRPILLGTTLIFLKNFGFSDLSELPEIEDIAGTIFQQEHETEAQQITIDLT